MSIPRGPPRTRWLARIVTGVPVLFLTLDATMKLVAHPEVIAGSERLGLPASLAPVCGVILLACVALYVIPRTAPLGAVLLTGYLGAVLVHRHTSHSDSNVRTDDPVTLTCGK